MRELISQCAGVVAVAALPNLAQRPGAPFPPQRIALPVWGMVAVAALLNLAQPSGPPPRVILSNYDVARVVEIIAVVALLNLGKHSGTPPPAKKAIACVRGW